MAAPSQNAENAVDVEGYKWRNVGRSVHRNTFRLSGINKLSYFGRIMRGNSYQLLQPVIQVKIEIQNVLEGANIMLGNLTKTPSIETTLPY